MKQEGYLGYASLYNTHLANSSSCSSVYISLAHVIGLYKTQSGSEFFETSRKTETWPVVYCKHHTMHPKKLPVLL